MDYTEFYLTYYQRMLAFAKGFLPAEDAEDVVHDIFLVLWERRDEMQRYRNPSAYLMQSVKHRCLDRLKSHRYKMRGEMPATQEDLVRSCSVVNNNVLRWMERIDIEYRLNMSINSMPKRCRTVFQMAYIKGMSHADIAQSLGITTSTVNTQVRIALRTVRSAFKTASWALAACSEPQQYERHTR